MRCQSFFWKKSTITSINFLVAVMNACWAGPYRGLATGFRTGAVFLYGLTWLISLSAFNVDVGIDEDRSINRSEECWELETHRC